MMLAYRLKQAWLGLTLQITAESIEQLNWELSEAHAKLYYTEQLKRDLDFAKAAIRDLQSKLPANWEAQQRAASDALGSAAIAKMHANPQDYLPSEHDLLDDPFASHDDEIHEPRSQSSGESNNCDQEEGA